MGAASLKMGREIDLLLWAEVTTLPASWTSQFSQQQQRAQLSKGKAGSEAKAAAFGNRLLCLCLKLASGETKKQHFLHVPFPYSCYKTPKGTRKL